MGACQVAGGSDRTSSLGFDHGPATRPTPEGEPHGLTATGASAVLAGLGQGSGPGRGDPKEQLQPVQGFAGTAVQEAVFPHPSQSLGQNVLQHPPEEPVRRFGQGLPVPGLAVLVAEGDLRPVVRHDV